MMMKMTEPLYWAGACISSSCNDQKPLSWFPLYWEASLFCILLSPGGAQLAPCSRSSSTHVAAGAGMEKVSSSIHRLVTVYVRKKNLRYVRKKKLLSFDAQVHILEYG